MRVLQATMLTMILFGACATASTQNNRLPNNSSQNPRPPMGNPTHDDNPIAAEMQHRATVARESDRQKKMIADTDHLLALANELKVDMDKTNAAILSVDVIKKADEIEKLAHDIKQRMKD
jgi:type VI protein secretion system component VasF